MKGKESRKSYSPISDSRYLQARQSSSLPVRKEINKLYEKRQSQVNKQEASRKLESTSETVQRKFGHLHLPSTSGKMSYRSGNPLKALAQKRRAGVSLASIA